MYLNIQPINSFQSKTTKKERLHKIFSSLSSIQSPRSIQKGKYSLQCLCEEGRTRVKTLIQPVYSIKSPLENKQIVQVFKIERIACGLSSFMLRFVKQTEINYFISGKFRFLGYLLKDVFKK